jgi:hypothetical protein
MASGAPAMTRTTSSDVTTLTVADLPSHRLTRTSSHKAISAITLTTFHARERVLPRTRPTTGQRPCAMSTDALPAPSTIRALERNHP